MTRDAAIGLLLMAAGVVYAGWLITRLTGAARQERQRAHLMARITGRPQRFASAWLTIAAAVLVWAVLIAITRDALVAMRFALAALVAVPLIEAGRRAWKER